MTHILSYLLALLFWTSGPAPERNADFWRCPLAAKRIPRVSEKGLARVEGHLDHVLRNQFPEFSRAEQLRFQAGERAMLERLRSGATTSQDIEFYLHELKESESAHDN